MALKIKVEDRVSTYPGRVIMTPVSGMENTYDMTRADSPIKDGTPINKELFDSKADTLTQDVTVYVATSGSDTNGDGTADAPFATIQKAVDSIPKHLNGYAATIDIASGVYEERVNVIGFSSGRLIIGVTGKSVEVRGFNIIRSGIVELKIPTITWKSGFSGAILYAAYGSKVIQAGWLTINAAKSTDTALGVAYCSEYLVNGSTIEVNNAAGTAIKSTLGSKVALYNAAGTGNTDFGLMAEQGGMLTYNVSTISSTKGNVARTGGRVFAGSAVAPSSVE